ncbi:alpha/beta-hydrolase [Lophiostoma macrostomum CBS 122681]|uniref:Alpha/beta-hydrolase n=1 Tax=Lophiostoma macrostomum CBS 122681 TaxID=1314788 RepID=A0A6A6T769_9PLEO|nr:alpha/beta-hydrolase [Lophiostoma macrostomum CBS 122681]
MAPYDSSRWENLIAHITTSSNDSIRLSYISCAPAATTTTTKGTILLIHGFPETSHQFRHVITPLSDAGYRVIAPDYRGAGRSSKPVAGYTKARMAEDLHKLLYSHIGISGKVHVVGHDIGGMIAYAYAQLHGESVASLVWGECALPGSQLFDAIKGLEDVFHFLFHQILDLPEALIAGKEDVYIRHFFDKQTVVADFLDREDFEVYVQAYKQPGAMRAALNVYRAFGEDARRNREWLKENGPIKVPSLGLFGGGFKLAELADGMVQEMCQGGEVRAVEACGHNIAEERPGEFVNEVLEFVGRHSA